MFKARAEIPGIVQVDIIEGGCKSILKSSLSATSGDTAATSSLSSHTADQIQIFPNPAVERIHVNLGLKFKDTHHLRLINLEGRVMMERTVSGTVEELEVGHLPTGTYYLIGLSDKTVLWQKPILKR